MCQMFDIYPQREYALGMCGVIQTMRQCCDLKKALLRITGGNTEVTQSCGTGVGLKIRRKNACTQRCNVRAFMIESQRLRTGTGESV